MEFGIRTTGSFDHAQKFLGKLLRGEIFSTLDKYGREGVMALRNATPVDTSLTASSWAYRVTKTRNQAAITWYNTHTEDGSVIAILLQYGHGTGTGGYVVGRDYINPSMRPIFDKIAENVWKEVTK